MEGKLGVVMKQALTLQALDLVRSPQLVPPCRGGVVMLLEDCCTPSPQEALQVLQELHWLTLQSTEKKYFFLLFLVNQAL